MMEQNGNFLPNVRDLEGGLNVYGISARAGAAKVRKGRGPLTFFSLRLFHFIFVEGGSGWVWRLDLITETYHIHLQMIWRPSRPQLGTYVVLHPSSLPQFASL